jgi:Lrp/AsnC family transcriptional regulator for asnA, asnC and gidA
MHKIDKTDRMIVNLLMEDGRMPCSELARRLGNTTERSVRYRLDRLRNEGIIKIAAVTNPLAMGYPVITDVFIEVEPGMIQEVAQKLVKFENITYVACSTGDRDISVQVVARSNPDAYAFVTEVIAKVPGVRKTTSSVVPLILKDVYDWHMPTSANSNSSGLKD